MELAPPLIFAASWLLLCFLLARVGGWRSLARHYRSRERFRGERLWMQTLRMRWMVNYGNGVNFGVDPRGLHLSMFLFFRPFHRSIWIPWSELSVAEVHDPLGARFVGLTTGSEPEITLYLSEGLALRLAEKAGGSWPGKARERVEAEAKPRDPWHEGSLHDAPADPETAIRTETLRETEKKRKAKILADLERFQTHH